MIYDIWVTSETSDFKDVEFCCAIEDYEGETFKRQVYIDRTRGNVIKICDWERSDSTTQIFDLVPTGDVPLWARRLFDHRREVIMEVLQDKPLYYRHSRFVQQLEKIEYPQNSGDTP